MALERTINNKPAPKAKQTRKIVLGENHLVEAALTRKDGTGNLFEAVVNIPKGEIAIKQTTVPFTAKSVQDVEDLQEFLGELANLAGLGNTVSAIQAPEAEVEAAPAK
jgi:hypothetical protein